MTEGKGHLPPEREVPPILLSIILHQCILQTHSILACVLYKQEQDFLK